jgi:hypothetical protein
VPAGIANVQFTKEGSLPAYYSISESGFDRNPPTAEISQGLEVIHEFLDAKGSVVTKVKVGDEFWVRLRLRERRIATGEPDRGGGSAARRRRAHARSAAGPGSNWKPQLSTDATTASYSTATPQRGGNLHL